MADDFGLDLGFGGGGLGIPRKRRRKIDEFSQEDEDTILGTLGNKALGGVAAIGNVLDLPGSSVRDLIAGENPFDQYLSPISPENRTTGRDLLRQSGMISGEDTTGNWWGGLGAEILLDPTTYLSGGLSALGKGGKAFKAAGVLDDAVKVGMKAGKRIGQRLGRMTTSFKQGFDLLDDAGRSAVEEYAKKAGLDLASVADEPIQSLGRVSLPFTDIGFNFGSGRLSQGIAGSLDWAGDVLKQTAPVRFGRALFDPAVNGKLGYAEQQIAEQAYKAKWKSERAAKVAHVQMLGQMSEGYKAFQESFGTATGGAAPEFSVYDKLVRLSAETGGDVEQAWKIVSDGAPDLSPEVAAQVKDIGDSFKKLNKDAHDEFLSKGGKSGTIAGRLADDATDTVGFSHLARSVDHAPKDLADLRAGRTLKASFDSAKGRDAVTRMVPTEIANRIAGDQVIRDAIKADKVAGTKTAAALIETKYGQFLDPAHKIDDVSVGKTGHADDLAQWASEQRQGDKYTRMTVEDQLKYQMGVQTANRNIDAMHEIVSRTQSERLTDGVTVRRAFKNAGLSDEAVNHWAKKNNVHPDLADGFQIPADVANALVSVNKIYDQPEWAKAIGETIDNFHGWWKNAMTVPFPSFHSRNFSSAQYMNLVASGLVETPSDLAMYGGEFQQALKMLTSTGVPREMQEELYTSGVLGKYTRSEDVGINAINANQLPGQPPSLSLNPLNALEQYKQTSAKMEASYLDAVPAGRFARTALSSVSDAGSRVAENVEFLNRVPLYNYLRKKGWSAEAAAQKVDDLHVNYSDLAPFEKNVMRRLIPFFAYQRRIAPVLMQTILERPGGGLAQTIKASADLSNADPLTPEHVSSTLAIPNPLKGDDFAGKSYFTGLGLPHEQLGQFFGGPQTILREAASQMSPIVKGPLEWATGQSFFQAGPGGKGRDLEDLDPTIGRTLGNIAGTDKWGTPTALEHIAANLPTSRVAGTLRQLTDTRKSPVEKGINLLTGVKVSDVSESNQERVIQQRALDLMDEMGARTFAKPYFPEGIEEAMTPEEQKQAQALELLQAVLADRQKRRKAKKKEK